MSFPTAGYVIFLPQRPVIDSAAGTGQGLPAWHRSLTGVSGVLRGHHSLPRVPEVLEGHHSLLGVPRVRGEQTPQSTPLHPPAWQETPMLVTEMLPWRKGSEPPRDPQRPRAGPRLLRDELSSPRDGAVAGGLWELAQPAGLGVARARRGSKQAGKEGGQRGAAGLAVPGCRPWARVRLGVRLPSSICWSQDDGGVWAGQEPVIATAPATTTIHQRCQNAAETRMGISCLVQSIGLGWWGHWWGSAPFPAVPPL